ncbi:hypothetical protein [Caulobacter sp. UC70_42]|uniref:hypothetical protein n=1 Tax=Caulobacter sp. UC70_42 TaxID=3374551 RepID=UPI0037563076
MRATLTLALLLGASGAQAQPPNATAPPPQTPAQFYQAGEAFARCSATFAYAALLAKRQGMEDSAKAFEGMERGWRLTGLILLTQGLVEQRQLEALSLFDTLQAIKVDQMKAQREADPDGFVAWSQQDYKSNCDQWFDLRVNMIRVMRGSAPPQ